MNWILHPIKSLFKVGIRKCVLNIVNNSIAKHKDNIIIARSYVRRYSSKVSALLRFLNSLDDKLSDSKFTDEEATALLEEAKEIAHELTA